MGLGSLKTWIVIHRWSSILCMPVVLLLCVTGLPLIFTDEIKDVTGAAVSAPGPDAPALEVEKLVAAAVAQRPGWHTKYLIWNEDETNVVKVELGRPDAKLGEDRGDVITALDQRTAKVLQPAAPQSGVMVFIRRLHTNLHAGDAGLVVLGVTGALFIVALLSGVILYAPFMRQLAFGEIRKNRSRRVKWVDLHNLLSIATIAWATVVGVTGVAHTLGDPIFERWRVTELAALIGPYHDKPAPQHFAPLSAVLEAGKAARPTAEPWVLAFPSTRFSTPHHYILWMRGNTAITSKLLWPVLVDAETARITGAPDMPLATTALRLMKPLHFGDYGGLPLKVLWAFFDVVTIIVILSGLYLWWRGSFGTSSLKMTSASRSAATGR